MTNAQKLIERKQYKPEHASLTDDVQDVVNVTDALAAIEIARLEAKIEAYEDAINGGENFTRGWLGMAKTSLAAKLAKHNLTDTPQPDIEDEEIPCEICECEFCGTKTDTHSVQCPNSSDPFHELLNRGYD